MNLGWRKQSKNKEEIIADEIKFRRYFLQDDVEQVVLLFQIGIAAVLLLCFIDYLFFKFTPKFFILLLMRVVFSAISLRFVWLLKNREAGKLSAIMDRLLLVWLFLLNGIILAVDISRPAWYTQNSALYIMVIFCNYTLTPTKLWNQFFPAICLSIANIIVLLFWKDPMTIQGMSMLIALMIMTHLIGIILSRRFLSYRQKQFLSKKEEVLAHQELEKLASTDDLTGLYNRRRFMEHLGLELSRYQRHKEKFCLLMLDLDYFKAINDQFGHDAGDEVLRQFSALLRKDSRGADIFSRVGGEEFAILCPATLAAEALELGNRICAVCALIVLPAEGRDFPRVTVSIGVTQVLDENDDSQRIIKRADQALYHAKRMGRNRVELL
ncbi:MAG: GGDEF domain-containing protein [Chloroflexota bacterium]